TTEAIESGPVEASPVEAPDEIPPYRYAEPKVDTGGRDLHEVPARRLAGWVREVVRAEGPLHCSEAAGRVGEAAGLKRTGRRIQAGFGLGVELATRQGSVRREGEFLWPAEMTRPAVRDRSELPPNARKLDLVAPEEIAAAVERVVVDAFGMEP